jgi:hypothetical protein
VSHHTEAFTEGTGAPWGWQCFTCGAERIGFLTLEAAERAADEHAAQ